MGNLFRAMVPIALIPFLVFHQSFLVAGEEAGKALIAKTCNQTEYPEECTSALESDARSLSANLTGLGRIAVEQSASKLNQTLSYVDSLVNNATDYATWASLVVCQYSYNASANQIQQGLQAFDQLKYDKTYQSVAAVNQAVIECNNQGLGILTQVDTALFRLTKDAMMIVDLLYYANSSFIFSL
ncbi:Pectinesterase inhibitor domain - like 10 [Theobroma cacao]|nr:Pectinesterase inhibitor domain - like 10 [Theobroma cacao]